MPTPVPERRTDTPLSVLPRRDFDAIMTIDRDEWTREIASHDDLFFKLYDRLPKEMSFIRELLLSGLWRSPERWSMEEMEFFDDIG